MEAKLKIDDSVKTGDRCDSQGRALMINARLTAEQS